jgi:hypothetical protein
MFSIDDKNYWIVVVKDENLDVFVVKCSDDVRNHEDEVLPYGLSSLVDNEIQADWADSLPIGVYKLELELVNDANGDLETVNVANYEPLFEVTE